MLVALAAAVPALVAAGAQPGTHDVLTKVGIVLLAAVIGLGPMAVVGTLAVRSRIAPTRSRRST